MPLCKACSAEVVGVGVTCDGICDGFFHANCLKRSSKVTTPRLTTCMECSEIKPCHVLRLMKKIADMLSTEQSFIAERVNSISTGWAGFQVLSEDLHALSCKVDKLLDATETAGSNSCSILEKSLEMSSKIARISAGVDDIQSMVSGFDFSSASHYAGAVPMSPVIGDIRRNVRQVRGDIESWSAVAARNSNIISSIAADMKCLISLRRACMGPASVGLSADGEFTRSSISLEGRPEGGRSDGVESDDVETSPAVSNLNHASSTSAAVPATSGDVDPSPAASSLDPATSAPTALPTNAPVVLGSRRRNRRRPRKSAPSRDLATNSVPSNTTMDSSSVILTPAVDVEHMDNKCVPLGTAE